MYQRDTLRTRLSRRRETIEDCIEQYLEYRGKAQKSEHAEFEWHPVAYHCLDVAACVNAMLEARPTSLSRGATLLRLPTDQTRRLLVALGALHDIGKFSESFFGRESLWPTFRGPYRAYPIRPHTNAGYELWQDVMVDRIGSRLTTGSIDDLDPLAVATFGHHGRPLARGRDPRHGQHFRLQGTTEAAVAFAEDAISIVCPEPVTAPVDWESVLENASWWVAGLISVADWLASDQVAFPYSPPTSDLQTYYELAMERAGVAVHSSGLTAQVPAALKSFKDLIGKDTPTAMQQWAVDVTIPAGPSLFIVEDATGTGKTEAAQVLVHRLMAAGRASGAYWGMPTQATANAMFDRQCQTIGALFDGMVDQRPSLVIAHGQAKLHEKFRSTVFDGWADSGLARNDADDKDSESRIACAAFIADDRRKAFLADIGAGTIDQALLGALPSKYNTMRLFGLAEKVLVLDEVHAYDAYVECETEALLEFHAALGGSAILLSATLTQRQRQKFTSAWWRGSGLRRRYTPPVREDASSTPYPLATVVGYDGLATEYELPVHGQASSTVAVIQVHDEAEVVRRVRAAHDGGQAVAWIRNTVDSALEAAELLRANGLHPIVFHARFAQCDRQAREREIMELFGVDSKGSARNRVLVATQVVEQSLDLDFDLLVSDLAPIDLLIQRAGRLWRHKRTRPHGSAPQLLVLTPPYENEPGARWLEELLPKTKYVYEDLGVLWRTLRELTEVGKITSPSGVRALVERVYADDGVPDSLEAASQKAQGKSAAQRATARLFSLDVAKGYAAGSSTAWHSDIRVPTRLADEDTVIRLARISDGQVMPWSGGSPSDWREWALSEVRVSHHKVGRNARIDDKYARAVEAVRSTWPKYERDVLVVVLETHGDGWQGGYLNEDDSRGVLSYSIGRGLRL